MTSCLRRLLRSLFPLVSLIPLVACPEPKDPFDAFMELQNHEAKLETAMFNLARAQLELLETKCSQFYAVDGKTPDPAKLRSCIDKVLEDLQAAIKESNGFTQQALTWTVKIFDNFKMQWLEGTNKQRADIKAMAYKMMTDAVKQGLDKVPNLDKKKSISTRVLKFATNELIREDLIAPGTTADLVATGRLLGAVGPGTIHVSFPVDAANRVTITDPDPVVGTQQLQFSGDAVLTARVDPTTPTRLRLEVSTLDLTGSNLDFNAVSTGDNHIALNPSEQQLSVGQLDLTTGQVSLDVALTATNDFVPNGVLFLNVSTSGQLRAAGSDTLLELTASGPAATAFPSESPAPPFDVATIVDASGGIVTLGEETTVTIPPGALAAPTEIDLFATAAILAPTSVPAGLTRVALTRELFPRGQNFNTPVTITIPYDNGDIAGLDASTLRALVFDPASSTWIAIPDSTVDVRQNLVTFHVSNVASGYFGIGGANISGDLDGDGDVDLDDLAIVLSALNTAASGPDDRRDLNKDGRIDIVDARILTTLCTRPNCATP